jgi:tRNA-2-methylthio-N6-dimethylallyladenosine synthase
MIDTTAPSPAGASLVDAPVTPVKKVYIKTFGCQMNEYDSAKMADVLAASREAWQPTEDAEEADLIVYNTCSIREKAAHKVFSDLGRAREIKARRGTLIAVGGCVASQEGAAIVERAPYVDIVFGPQTLHRLPQLIEARRLQRKPQVDISFPSIEKFDNLPPARVQGASAFVSIMEGCSKYCAYCVVPYTRGEEVSRPLADVLNEVAELAQQGVREVTLLGQNVNGWREPASKQDASTPADRDDPTDSDFAWLLECVASIPGIERLRYTTSHPNEFTQRLIDAYAMLPQLVDHVHLPVQHASDRILSAMKRGYSIVEFKSIVRRLRAVRPNISIGSDFIVGYPGETEDDFAKLLQLVQDLGFDNSFSFIYSPRPGTPAAALADDTPHAVKLERLQRLQALLDAQSLAISRSRVGTVQRVLIEGRARKDAREWKGRTACNRIVNLSAGGRDLSGQLLNVRITEALPHSLRGEWVVLD